MRIAKRWSSAASSESSGRRSRVAWPSAVAIALGGVALLAGCERSDDAADEVEDAVEEVGDAAEDTAESVEDSVDDVIDDPR